MPEGEPFTLRIAWEPRGACLTVNDDTRCDSGTRASEGWAAILYPGSGPAAFFPIMSVVWLGAWAIPAAFWAPTVMGLGLVVAGLGTSLVIGPATGTLTSPTPTEGLAVLVAVACGAWLRRRVRRSCK